MKHYLAIVSFAALIAGCSGGSGAPSVPPTSSAKTSGSTKTLTIKIPSKASSSSGALKRPAYISPATESATLQILTAPMSNGQLPAPGTTYTPYGSLIAWNLTPTAPGCSQSNGATYCVESIFFPYLTNTAFEALMTTYAGANGTGPALSSNLLDYASGYGFSTSGNIGNANTLQLSLGGIPYGFQLTESGVFTPGTGGSGTLSLAAYDAEGYQIVGAASDYSGCGNPSQPNGSDIGNCSEAYQDGNGDQYGVVIATASNTTATLSMQDGPGSGTTCASTNPSSSYWMIYSWPACNQTVSYTGTGTDTLNAQVVSTNAATGSVYARGPGYTINPFVPSPTLSVTLPTPAPGSIAPSINW